jgi:hypothetical protein
VKGAILMVCGTKARQEELCGSGVSSAVRDNCNVRPLPSGQPWVSASRFGLAGPASLGSAPAQLLPA